MKAHAILSLLLTALILIVPSVGGCAKKLPYKVVIVEGKLTHAGKPLENFAITFTPEGGGRPSSALTKEEGTFKAKYTPTIQGVQVGKSVMTIEYIGTYNVTGRSTVPREYVELTKKYAFGTPGYPVEITKTDKNFVIDLP